MIIEPTGDGSHTIFVPELNEHYHSTFGAISESQHIFIGHGLKSAAEVLDSVSILEIGFGTGLNALLTVLEAQILNKKILYHSVEAFPLQEEIWKRLNYAQQTRVKGAEEIFNLLHTSTWDKEIEITSGFTLKKILRDLKDFIADPETYNLIYFDAFGPDVQPELWTKEIFTRLYNSLKPGGQLVTYSVKGTVKRALKDAGFMIKKLPGPAGKREILKAFKEL